MNPSHDYDLVVIGGGMVGASLACALGDAGLRIAIVEAVPYRAEHQPSYDDRAIALSYGSRRIFEGMGLWPALASTVTPIRRIHVSDRGRFGITRMDSGEEGVEALGYVVLARLLGHALTARLAQLPRVDIISPATLVGLEFTETQAAAVVDVAGMTRTVRAPLIVAADGGQSTARVLLHIDATRRDYGQTAIIANVTPERGHNNIAYERFTPHGPIALLPMADGRCGLVWTHRHGAVDETMALDDNAFLAQLHGQFGDRLGRFVRVGKRHAYPLTLLKAREQIRERLVLIGNAAHTLHPIAGQGFNLGLRDVAALAQVLTDAQRAGADWGGAPVLAPYAAWRKRDQDQAIVFTDALVRLFSNQFPPLGLARSIGLLATDLVPPLKHRLARHAMGLAGTLPRLARGLPL